MGLGSFISEGAANATGAARLAFAAMLGADDPVGFIGNPGLAREDPVGGRIGGGASVNLGKYHITTPAPIKNVRLKPAVVMMMELRARPCDRRAAAIAL
jgi:hypothetical protein